MAVNQIDITGQIMNEFDEVGSEDVGWTYGSEHKSWYCRFKIHRLLPKHMRFLIKFPNLMIAPINHAGLNKMQIMITFPEEQKK